MIERKKRLMMMQKSGGLPAEYQQIEYLQSSGTQYINTNYICSVNPLIKTRMKIDSQSDRDIFGFINNVYPSFIVDCGSTRWYNRFGLTGYSVVIYEHGFTAHDWEFGQTFKADGDIIQTYSTDIDWSLNKQHMYLFSGRNISGGMTIYDCKLYDGGSLVRNFIPCIRKSDNKPGMYDTVSKTFYTNAGTGEFIIPT